MQLPRTTKSRGLAWLVFLAYFAALLIVVLFKNLRVLQLRFGSISPVSLGARVHHGSNFTPFTSIAYYLGGNPSTATAVENLAGNILVFMPMGFLLPIVLPKLQRMRQIAVISFVISLSIEVIQLLTGMGVFDVDDVLLNVLGATLGWLIYRGLRSVPLRSLRTSR